MKTLLTISLFCFSKVYSQKKHEIGFYFAPVKQSVYDLKNTDIAQDEFTPFFSLSIETGLYYIHKINSSVSLQHNVHFGVLNHSTKIKIPSSNNVVRNSISIDEAAYSLGYSPKITYVPFQKLKQFQLIAGVGAKYFFDVSAGNYRSIVLSNGAKYEEILFANGSINNIEPNEQKWQYNTEIGINYDVNLAKKRVLLKINPFYQYSFNTVYTGVYRYTKGAYTENGNFNNKVHQTGLRFMFGFTF
jgi:hypothetical protein